MAVSKRIQLDTGLQYHYLEWDEVGSDHTVVLVHGFLDFCGGWRATVASGLDRHFHVVAPDMRGHGDSDRVGAGGYYHFFDYIADLRSFIKSLGRERVALVGHSMGGSIAGYYAGSFPDSLSHLALLEGMGPPDNQTPLPEQVQLWIRGWQRARGRSPQVYESTEAAAAKLRQRDSLLSQELADQLAHEGTRAVAEGRVFKHDPLHLTMGPMPYSAERASEFWQRIQCPVLLVEGSESTMRHSAEEGQRRAGALPNYQSVTLQGAGHMMQRHTPEMLCKLLLDFLS